MTNEEAKTFLDNLKVCIEEHPIVADWLVEIADRKDEPQPCEWCKFSDGENCFSQEPCKVMLYFKTEPQTNKDFKVTYTCSFTDCDNFKNFGFGEKCIECKRKQSEAKYKDEPQTEREGE